LLISHYDILHKIKLSELAELFHQDLV